MIELHVPDFKPVKDYYKKLGFNIVWERAEEGHKGYMVMELENNLICFWCGNESVYEQSYFSKFPKTSIKGYGVEIVFLIDNVENYYERLEENNIEIFQPLATKPWGLKDFRMVDPFGFLP